MQRQTGPGWRLMGAELGDLGAWSLPQPVDPGPHPDFDPRLSGDSNWRKHLVWQRGTGNAAEIMYGAAPRNTPWTIEPITSNATEDVSPDIADLWPTGQVHVAWAGFDPETNSGKIFHAARSDTGWQVERLIGSELGPFWTGAEPRIAIDYHDILHVIYRGGDFGNYHAHYARKENGSWTYQVLLSDNGNDFSVDVTAEDGDPIVAMSGNDGFGFPLHIYVRESLDGGVTFTEPRLVSGNFSAELANVTDGWYGVQVVGSEVSGNIYTGNAIISRSFDNWVPELLPPMNQASQGPSNGQSHCIAFFPGEVSAFYTNDGGAGADSAEVYFLSTHPSGGVQSPALHDAATGPRIQAAPNPLYTGTWITIAGADQQNAAIYAASGRLIRQLGPLTSGDMSHRFYWNGDDADGRRLPSGAYYLGVKDGGKAATQRLVIVR